MPRTENTEIHRKSAEQIRAIESVAQENRRIANVLEQRANLPKFVIDLVKGISCFKAISGKLCPAITSGQLALSAQRAYAALGFQPDAGGTESDLITLCDLIVPEPNPDQNCPSPILLQTVTATSKSDPTSSPTATRPPGKGSGKKG